VKTHFKKYSQVEMLPLETKRSGGKLLPHSDLRRGVFPEEVSRNRKRDIVLGTWNVRSLYRAGEWRKLHNEELSDLYSLPSVVRVVKSRRMRRAGHVAHMGEGRGVYRVLVGIPEGKRPLGRPRRRWKYNIKMDLQEVGGSCGDWMELAQDSDRWRALVGTVRNLRVPKRRGIS